MHVKQQKDLFIFVVKAYIIIIVSLYQEGVRQVKGLDNIVYVRFTILLFEHFFDNEHIKMHLFEISIHCVL